MTIMQYAIRKQRNMAIVAKSNMAIRRASGPIAVRQPAALYLVCHLSLLLPRPVPTASISNITNT